MNLKLMSKGFLDTIKEFSEIKAERVKIMGDIMMSEFKAKRNFIWNIAEKNTQTDYQKKLMQMFEQQQGGGGNGGGAGEYNINAPRVELGTTGPEVKYPSTGDKEFAIKYHLTRIKKKKQSGMALTDQETEFREMYPEDVWMKQNTVDERKILENKILQGTATPEEKTRYEEFKTMGRIDVTQSKQTEEDIRTKIAQGETLTPEEVNYYNKFMWRTGNEMKPPKKDKFGYYTGQKMKGHIYIGNNQWQAE